MANPRIVVDFVANTRDLTSGMSTATGAAGGLGSRFKQLGRASLAAAGAAGVGALVATFKTGISEFTEASKVSAQTEAVLKSTGGAAGVSAKQVANLANSLMKKTGIDDEAIQSGENLLLTFKNVQNQAGKGNDIFNQATKVMTDMSVALGQDMKTSATQLGKALNDPVKGITALQRVGVTFTQGQKDQIKALVDSGKTMDAQKIILKELNSEFGGSAEAAGKTLPGQLNILKQQFSNMAGELVGSLVPAFSTLLGVFTKVMGALGPFKGALPVIVGAMAALAAIVITVSAATAAWTAITALASAATAVWTAAQWLLNAALLANPIALVVVAVAALVAAFVVAYKTSDTFRAIVDAAFDAVLSVAQTLFNWLKANWPLLLGIITGPIGLATVAIIRNWDTIQSGVMAAVNAVRSAISSAWSAVRSATTAAFDAVEGAVTGAVSAVKTALSSMATWVSGFASGVLSTAVHRVEDVFDFIANGARDAYAAVQRNLNGIVNFIEGIVEKVGNAASSVANAIKRPINAVLSAWNAVELPRVAIKIPSIKIGKKKIGGGSFGFGPFPFPNVPLLQQGGVIDQPTLAIVGEGPGREIVAPESLLRQIMAERAVQVRVFIGDTELTDMVRTEIVDANTGLARSLLAGGPA
jgi:ElaB/YqjD/DUF883 family membrane-anchored ribosome-binding protein